MLLEDVWDFNFVPQTNVVDVQIGNLRRKLDPGDGRRFIINMRAVGFKLDVERLRSSTPGVSPCARLLSGDLSRDRRRFALIYFEVSRADVARVGAILVDEAAKASATARTICAGRSSCA